MKKYLLIAVLMCLATLVKAQTEGQPDYCQQISRDTDATQAKRTYQSPDGPIVLTSIVNASGQTVTITFSTTDFSLYEDEGLFIKFTDGKTLRLFGQHIEHKYVSSVTGYSYQTTLTLSPEKLDYIKTKKLALYQIASMDVNVDSDTATQIQAYANCMANLK